MEEPSPCGSLRHGGTGARTGSGKCSTSAGNSPGDTTDSSSASESNRRPVHKATWLFIHHDYLVRQETLRITVACRMHTILFSDSSLETARNQANTA